MAPAGWGLHGILLYFVKQKLVLKWDQFENKDRGLRDWATLPKKGPPCRLFAEI